MKARNQKTGEIIDVDPDSLLGLWIKYNELKDEKPKSKISSKEIEKLTAKIKDNVKKELENIK